MTIRERIYRSACTHLLCQKQRSILPSGAGLYGMNGRRDPVGLFIDVEYYHADLELQRGLSRKVVEAVEQSLGCALDEDCVYMLQRLHGIHGSVDSRDWLQALRALARELDLPTPKRPGIMDRINAHADRVNHESWCLRFGFGQPLDAVLRC